MCDFLDQPHCTVIGRLLIEVMILTEPRLTVIGRLLTEVMILTEPTNQRLD